MFTDPSLRSFPASVAVTLALLCSLWAAAQPATTSPLSPPANGPRRVDPTWIALTGATVHVSPQQIMRRASVVVRDGMIVSVLPAEVGADGQPDTDDDQPARLPIGPRVIPCDGMHIYAAFIDPYIEVDAPAPPSRDANNPGAHWSPMVTPQRSALDGNRLSESDASGLRELGFGAACISPRGGVFRGSSAVVSLSKPASDGSAKRPPIYRDSGYQSVAFEMARGGYPSSQMGAIALIRQTLSDAAWHNALTRQGREARAIEEGKLVLGTLDPTEGPRPALLFNSDNELEALRAGRIAVEFDRPYMILGSGMEFARLDAIRSDASGPLWRGLILPLNFPKNPDVSSPGKADSVELREMMVWEQAPTNPRRLHEAGIEFAFTTSKLRKRSDFLPHVRKAVLYGLPQDVALAAMTTRPAAMLGVSEQLGTVESGKRANLLVTDSSIFDKKCKLRTLLIDGNVHELSTPPLDLEGEWDVTIPGAAAAKRRLVIDKDNAITLHRDDRNVKCSKVIVEKGTLSFTFDHGPLNKDADAPDSMRGVYLMSGAIEFDTSRRASRIVGQGVRSTGERFDWSATRRPPSLAGDWPIFFETEDAARQRGGVLRVTESDDRQGSSPSLTLARSSDDGTVRTLTPRDVVWDGATLSYRLTRDDLQGQSSDVSVRATLDRTSTPHTLKGAVRNDAGQSFPFTARRTDADKWWTGRWRVIELDGQRKPADAKDHIELDIEEKGLTVVFINQPFTPGKPQVRIKAGNFDRKDNVITYTYDLNELGKDGESKDTLTRVDGELHGAGTEPDGSTHKYILRRIYEDKKDEDTPPKDIPELLPRPFGPYGLAAFPTQDDVLLTNATVWTNTSDGILQNATVLLRQGRIAMIAPRIDASSGVRVIDCTGRHITAGIIDAHSHTGISRGVNEGAQAVTSEVRIQDVTNPDDVNWYRQLAGGVTSVLQLHGSANAIGGQSQTTKLRWGCARPEDMHFDGAATGIKFALGENPRSVNGNPNTDQYPRTRMGVEMLIRDRFTAAREYARHVALPASGHFTPLSPGTVSLLNRRDLELEALAEVLAGSRLIHCHSYRQDEMVMMATVARDFGFKLGTYTHALEGYKVADYVRESSLGASGFTDWWAYKVEVQDAIPQAFPIMHKAGVTTSFNSDSNELARRMNVEAAKAVKYGDIVGGISEEEALKFVTLNPAKQLKIDHRVGAIKVGLDADIVVWSGSPLSPYSKAERTFVDGRELFSLEQDASLRARIRAERGRLVQKILTDGIKPREDKPDDAGSPGTTGDDASRRRRRPPSEVDHHNEPARGITDEQRATLERLYLDMHMSGRDPRFLPGVCGCGAVHAY